MEDIIQVIHKRTAWINEAAAGTACGDLQMILLEGNPEKMEFIFLGHTNRKMENVIGTLHGGSAALIADQAMGTVANSMFQEDGHAPTSQLSLNFHRPMTAGEDVLVRVRVVNTSRRQIHLSCEIYQKKTPEKLCISASSVFFRTGKE